MALAMEANIDGMIGPTHHYGGLGVGNLASQSHRYSVSNPRLAALEGLEKMELVASRSVPQFVLPPPVRPNWMWLESIGCRGTRSDMLKQCRDSDPSLLSAAYSSAFMWTANAATVVPSKDSADSTLNILVANLCSNLHRGQESTERTSQLKSLFRNVRDARVMEALPSVFALRDEGAANHMRLWDRVSEKALHVFVHGPKLEQRSGPFVGRQSVLASKQVACGLGLPKDVCVFLEQSQEAIQAGVFHNDVIATSHANLFIVHEKAFELGYRAIDAIADQFLEVTHNKLHVIRVHENDLPLPMAVQTYLFNSQLLDLGHGKLELLCPDECRNCEQTKRLIDYWIHDPDIPIQRVSYISLNQSMSNGGGPACLRLRVMVQPHQLREMDQRLRVSAQLLAELRRLVDTRYPTRVTFSDLERTEFAEHSIQTAELIQRTMTSLIADQIYDSN